MTGSRSTTTVRGSHRHSPPCPPIDPALVYPWRRLRDWGIGGRGVQALTKAGFRGFQFGKLKFFRGAELITILEKESNHESN